MLTQSCINMAKGYLLHATTVRSRDAPKARKVQNGNTSRTRVVPSAPSAAVKGVGRLRRRVEPRKGGCKQMSDWGGFSTICSILCACEARFIYASLNSGATTYTNDAGLNDKRSGNDKRWRYTNAFDSKPPSSPYFPMVFPHTAPGTPTRPLAISIIPPTSNK
jgi:hypothetical protein